MVTSAASSSTPCDAHVGLYGGLAFARYYLYPAVTLEMGGGGRFLSVTVDLHCMILTLMLPMLLLLTLGVGIPLQRGSIPG